MTTASLASSRVWGTDDGEWGLQGGTSRRRPSVNMTNLGVLDYHEDVVETRKRVKIELTLIGPGPTYPTVLLLHGEIFSSPLTSRRFSPSPSRERGHQSCSGRRLKKPPPAR